MIPSNSLESWQSIFSRNGLKPLHRGRGECPFCESRTGFSCHEERGFHCFACGEHGDKITFIQKICSTDFKGSLAFFGLDASKPPAPDPERVRQQQEERQHWAHLLRYQRVLQEQFRIRNLIAYHGGEYLCEDPDSTLGWALLSEAYRGRPLAAIEDELDELLQRIPREAYPRPEELRGYELSQSIQRARSQAAA